MFKFRIFLALSTLAFLSYAQPSCAEDSNQATLAQEPQSAPAKAEMVPIDKDAIGAKRVEEDPTQHSLAHNTHQATRSILHDTHQGTKAIVHGTTNGIKRGAGFITDSLADGVSKGSSAVSDFFNKIGGN